MSKEAFIAKYEALPITAQEQVETFIEFLSKKGPAKSTPSSTRRFRFDWAGGLGDLKDQFTAVGLQHQLNAPQ